MPVSFAYIERRKVLRSVEFVTEFVDGRHWVWILGGNFIEFAKVDAEAMLTGLLSDDDNGGIPWAGRRRDDSEFQHFLEFRFYSGRCG